MLKRALLFATLGLGAAIAGGCGGSDPTATITAAPTPTGTFFLPQSTVNLSTTGSTSTTILAGSTTATVVFPAISLLNQTLTVGGVPGLPSGTTPLLRPRAESNAAIPTAVAAVQISSPTDLTLPTTPRFAFVLPTPAPGASAQPNVQYFIGYLAPDASWVEPLLGPGTLAAGTVSFPVLPQAMSIQANQTYDFALYTLPL